MSEELVLNIDEIEEQLKPKKNKLLVLIIFVSILMLIIFEEFAPSFRKYYYQYEIFLISPILTYLLVNSTYYFLLKNIFCPYCSKLYFNPYLANKEQIKSLMKSDPACVNCNKKAKIISDYKVLY